MATLTAPSSPATPFSSTNEALDYYKSQYEQLEVELQEFQASSKELEAELERDVEASEKRERTLKEKVESLTYEVEEWKTKCKQSKTEANSAQTQLEKEITSLRDTNRTLQLRLRDIEVANDDFERQARHTTSSLEDMESKYNITIERGVMLEEEIKVGDQEREKLRIEVQRLRDELSDLKVEAEITQDKLRAAESANGRRIKRISQLSDQVPRSPVSDRSGPSAFTISTPQSKSGRSTVTSDAVTPPSPPLSDTSVPLRQSTTVRSPQKPRPSNRDSHKTSFSTNVTNRPNHTRGPSNAGTTGLPPSFMRSTHSSGRASGASQAGLPRSGSLYQIRGLIGKMQKLEERVQSARSKLPAPTNTPPRASPRGTTNVGSNLAGTPLVPSTVTVRSNRKRSSVSTNTTDTTNTTTPSRQSIDGTRTLLHRPSRMSFPAATESVEHSRPSSQASNPSHSEFLHHQFSRPTSRTSFHHRPGSALDGRRARSSMSGSIALTQGLRPLSHSATVDESMLPTPTNRRSTLERNNTGIPTPSTLMRRQSSSALATTPSRRQNTKSISKLPPLARTGSDSKMGPPERRENVDLGETY